MATATETRKTSVTRSNVRSGRPPKENAGEVEERILDAARKVFLDRGFEGASVEEIAETARSGKPAIYCRFANKQALFAATVTHYVAARNARLRSHTPAGTTIEERLTDVGVLLLHEALTGEWIGLVRLAIAEARRFPDLGSSIVRMTRERGIETLAGLLGEVAGPCEWGTPPAFGPDRFAAAARYFLDLIRSSRNAAELLPYPSIAYDERRKSLLSTPLYERIRHIWCRF
ncbi:MAG: TetR/AcrR family transcriptional regulator, partial [Rhodomicrobium sp.]